jgi:hypothetical protein
MSSALSFGTHVAQECLAGAVIDEDDDRSVVALLPEEGDINAVLAA